MLLIDELLLLNNYFGRNMRKMRYFYWKIAKIAQRLEALSTDFRQPLLIENSWLRHCMYAISVLDYSRSYNICS